MADENKDQKGKEQSQEEKEPELSPFPKFSESVSEDVPRSKSGLPDMPAADEEEGGEEGAGGSESEKSDDEKAKAAKEKDGSAPSPEDEKQKKSESKPKEGEGDDDLPEGAKKRIDQVTARAHNAERTAKELKEKLAQRDRELAELSGKEKGGEKDKSGEKDKKPAGADDDIPPDPDDPEPKADDFENDEEGWDAYHTAVRAWDRRQILKLVKQEGEKSKAAEQQKTAEQFYNERVQALLEQGKKLHEDFETVAKGEILYDDQLPIVLRSDSAAEILYHLGTNPDEAERLSAISDPVDFAREIGKLEARFPSSSGDGSDNGSGSPDNKGPDGKTKKKSSMAPAPLESIGGREKVTRDPNEMSTEEYYKTYP